MVWRDGLFYEVNSETPFTGAAVSKYENGRKAYEGTLKDGKLDGPGNWWHENGQKKGEVINKDGEIVSGTWWDEEGNEIKE